MATEQLRKKQFFLHQTELKDSTVETAVTDLFKKYEFSRKL